MYFWKLNEFGRVGWFICLIYIVAVALRLARFNVNSSDEPSWKDNFFEGIPSPAGGILVLMPLFISFSELTFLNLSYDLLVPILFFCISILLISKVPTYSLKKIIVPRRISIFLIFGVVIYFVLLLVYTFNTIVVSGLIYLLTIPLSSAHFLKIRNKFRTKYGDNDDHEDIL